MIELIADAAEGGAVRVLGLAGEDVFRLCDIMCGRLAAEAQNRRQVLSGR